MRVRLDPEKSVEKNAEWHYEQSKKAKRKAKGTREAIQKLKEKLERLKSEKEEEIEKIKEDLKRLEEKRERRENRKWYEKFHWFLSSNDFLCIGGRDAGTNEQVVKKHAEKGDLVFHTEMPGSPFFVIKSEGRDIPEEEIEQAALATAAYSKAWKKGMTRVPVFYVEPEQLTKEAPSGEYVPRGGFMVEGEREYITADLTEYGIGILKDGRIMAGPLPAVKEQCEDYMKIKMGNNKTSECAKKVQHELDGDLDHIIKVIPAGGCKIESA